MVSPKRYAIDLVLFPAINFVDEYDLVCMLLKISVHRRIKKPFLLKMVDEIPSPFFHQVAINGSLGIDRNQFLHLPPGQERNDGKSAASNGIGSKGATFTFEKHATAFC